MMSMKSAFHVEVTKPLTPQLSQLPLPKLQKTTKLQHDKSKVELKKADGSSNENGSSWEDVDEKSDGSQAEDKSASNDDKSNSLYASESSQSDYFDEETLPVPKLHPKLVAPKKA